VWNSWVKKILNYGKVAHIAPHFLQNTPNHVDVLDPIFEVHGALLDKAKRLIKGFEVQLRAYLNGPFAVESGHVFERALHQRPTHPVPTHPGRRYYPPNGRKGVRYARRY
jgi:hypothetical protein